MFIAGIDGGGTSTKLELRTEQNERIRREKFGPFNINSIGPDAFRALLRQVFDACGGMEDCAALCVGAAGISNRLLQEILNEELENANFHGKFLLCGDQEIALRGAMDGPGVALISGTGSIAFGKDELGNTARSGGYGHLIDDEGSGYALGRDGLAAVVRAEDGRIPPTALTQAVYGKLGISTVQELIAFTYSPDTGKAGIAQISHQVLACAEAGDEAALRVLRSGAEELSTLVQTVQKKRKLQGCRIALLGGLIEGDNIYRRIVAEVLREIGDPIAPAHDALWGAAQMAYESL